MANNLNIIWTIIKFTPFLLSLHSTLILIINHNNLVVHHLCLWLLTICSHLCPKKIMLKLLIDEPCFNPEKWRHLNCFNRIWRTKVNLGLAMGAYLPKSLNSELTVLWFLWYANNMKMITHADNHIMKGYWVLCGNILHINHFFY